MSRSLRFIYSPADETSGNILIFESFFLAWSQDLNNQQNIRTGPYFHWIRVLISLKRWTQLSPCQNNVHRTTLSFWIFIIHNSVTVTPRYTNLFQTCERKGLNRKLAASTANICTAHTLWAPRVSGALILKEQAIGSGTEFRAARCHQLIWSQGLSVDLDQVLSEFMWGPRSCFRVSSYWADVFWLALGLLLKQELHFSKQEVELLAAGSYSWEPTRTVICTWITFFMASLLSWENCGSHTPDTSCYNVLPCVALPWRPSAAQWERQVEKRLQILVWSQDWNMSLFLKKEIDEGIDWWLLVWI